MLIPPSSSSSVYTALKSALAAPAIAAPAKPAKPPSDVPAPKGGVIGRFFHNALKWVLTPYLNYATKMGEKEFLHPDVSKDSETPAKLGLPGQKLSFKSSDGTPLTGWYVPASPDTGKTVVLAHGHGGQQGSMLKNYAAFLHESGYNVVSFDFRDSGSSGGTTSTIGYDERHDLSAAIDQAALKGGNQIAVLGVSMGATTAIDEAADDPRVKAVIADCPFDTLYDSILPRVKTATVNLGPFKNVHLPFPKLVSEAILSGVKQVTGEPLTTQDPIRQVAKLKDRPLLLIHGGADTGTPPVDSKNLYAADPGADKSLWIVPGATHTESYKIDSGGYKQHVLGLLSRTLT